MRYSLWMSDFVLSIHFTKHFSQNVGRTVIFIWHHRFFYQIIFLFILSNLFPNLELVHVYSNNVYKWQHVVLHIYNKGVSDAGVIIEKLWRAYLGDQLSRSHCPCSAVDLWWDLVGYDRWLSDWLAYSEVLYLTTPYLHYISANDGCLLDKEPVSFPL